ncbi:kinetoplast DNA-associated protein [Trypanosoma conorhini]|uniref:Kinetoplast DNA-associated protein n=1 Tax=Trypanosoma conorhini TaxID=83891 RepID=A0A422NBH3_9TRYP|nr:kinetoplast DNA-associated protein [Trypanosoma conorhini]RNF02838.1 kinetoplast DNA-associated protein [Trypanosoma conorhini]
MAFHMLAWIYRTVTAAALAALLLVLYRRIFRLRNKRLTSAASATSFAPSASFRSPKSSPASRTESPPMVTSTSSTEMPVTALGHGSDHRAAIVKGKEGKQNIFYDGVNFENNREIVKAIPFLGFSLADNVLEGALVVDGLFSGGPAHQAGLRIDDELLEVNGGAVLNLQEAHELVAENCVPGSLASMTFRRQGGEPFEVQLRVMTAECRFSGDPLYFDPTRHGIQESAREKRETSSWRDLQ